MKTDSNPKKATSKPKRAATGNCARESCSAAKSGSFSISVEAEGEAAGRGVTRWRIVRRKSATARQCYPIWLEFTEPVNGAAIFGYILSQRGKPGYEYSHYDVEPDPENGKLTGGGETK